MTVFGATSTDHGPYTVSLDGGTAQSFTGLSAYFHPQQILVRLNLSLPVTFRSNHRYQYVASGLDLADHTLVVTHAAEGSEIYFDLDYVVVSTWGTNADAKASPSAETAVPPSGTPNVSTSKFVTFISHDSHIDHRGRITEKPIKPFRWARLRAAPPEVLLSCSRWASWSSACYVGNHGAWCGHHRRKSRLTRCRTARPRHQARRAPGFIKIELYILIRC